MPTFAPTLMPQLLPFLAVLVGAVWAASALDGFVSHDYTPLGITTPVMLVVTGALFALRNGGHK